MRKTITVEVAYAKPSRQKIISIKVLEQTTIQEAILRSGILDEFPEIDLTENKVGVFGKAAMLDTVLRDKDRIEIYRPLLADPKEARRKRVEQEKNHRTS